MAWFLGPKAENAEIWEKAFRTTFDDVIHWRRNYFPDDPPLRDRKHRQQELDWREDLHARLSSILGELKSHFPFYSQRYIGHMLSEQTLPSVLGYFAGLLYNPNNVTDEAAPVTIRLELEVGRLISEMLGYNSRTSWAHLCSGGTTANVEALWVARNVQFAPIIAQQFCKERRIDFEVAMPNGKNAEINDLSPAELVGLKSNHAVEVLGELARHLITNVGLAPERVSADLTTAVRGSVYNPAIKGIHTVLRAIQLSPIIFVSAAAHYSIRKAANLLGYGEEAVSLIPVTNRFRMDVDALYEAMCALPRDKYIATVIGIAGTTEEGAVDPLHEIHFVQQRSCQERNRSFWFHIDAAWGGYFRALFCGHSLAVRKHKANLTAICSDYARAIAAQETFDIPVDGGNFKKLKTAWNDPEVYSALLAMGDSDSITVDPHKMGYVPYPAGIVAFRNGNVRRLMTQKAQYISDEEQEVGTSNRSGNNDAVGPYALEGSKPGAAAAGCWLAHTLIPLTHKGHGRIVQASLMSARKLNTYLNQHRYMFRTIDQDLFEKSALCRYPFTFFPLYEPDTNVICYIVVPMSWQNGTLVNVDVPLQRLNELNERIYREFSIPGTTPAIPAGHQRSRLPYGQSYFVSRTRLEDRQYAFGSIRQPLMRLNISETQYKTHGLFVLRSAVMNPLYAAAEREGKNYLLDFVRNLHQVARSIVPATCWLYDTALKAS